MRSTLIGLTVTAALVLVGAIVLMIASPPWGDDPAPPPELAVAGRAVDLPEARGLYLKPGKDRQLVESYCSTCHSLAPIVRHEGFTREVWKQEVRKMIERYGAPIEDEEARRITAYLQRHYSSPPPPAAGTSAAPGTP